MISALDLAEAIFPEGKVGMMAFLKVYGDESYDDSLYTCGSFLSWPAIFYYLGLEWDDRLKKDGIAYFRSYDCEHLQGEFRLENPPGFGLNQARARADSIRHDLVQIIQRKTIAGISVSIVRKDFEALVSKNRKARKCFGTDLMIFTYRMLVKHTVGLMEQDFPETKYRGLKAGFVFDEHSNWRKAEEAYDQLKQQDALCAKRMLVASHADDREYPGLQMADLMAYEARIESQKWLDSSDEERHSMKNLKRTHNVYFMGIMARKQLLAELEKCR
jgi:hypothetical protein